MAIKPISLDNLTRAVNKLKDFFVQIKDAVLSVNGNLPDGNGNITVSKVEWADELESASSQSSRETYTIRTTGGSSSINGGSAWLMNLHGTSVKTGVVLEVLEMNVEPIPREEGEPITATLDADVFKAAVSGSTTITLTYTTDWNVNPATLGVTVTGTPIAGDQIIINYVEGNRGTITNATPTSFVSTGWNLYDHANTRARVVNYSDDYGYRIDGTYTALKFSATLNGEQSDLYVFNNIITGFPEGWTDGYIWVTGGNGTTTAIYTTWSDWTGGYAGEFAAFTSTGIDLSSVMANAFPNGMMRVASTYDELNLNVGQAISRIQRLEYSSENLQIAEESGRDYDTDENYIYLVRETPIVTNVSISSAYTANDHGLEWFNSSEVGVEAQTIYGASLKNKLERDVLTISQQTLTSAQQTQARSNIGAGSAEDVTALQNKYGIFGNSVTPITDLNNLPDNGDGYCTLSASLSPTGAVGYFAFKKYGIGSPNNLYAVLITLVSGSNARRVWVGNVANGTFGGWKELADNSIAVVKSKTVTENTGSGGYINIAMDNASQIIIGVCEYNTNSACVLRSRSGANWNYNIAKLQLIGGDYLWKTVFNTDVTLTVYYIG